MADKTVLIKLDVQEAGAISSIEQLNNSLKNLDKSSDEYAEVLKKIQVEESKLASIQASRVKSQKNVTNVINQQKDATGSATAATMELSRVVSDAPYGIRGMANNITQLVSQLGTASKSAGGLGAALKLMGSQLMGPLGVVFAITAAVSALDYFYGGAKKAAKAMSEFTNTTYAQSLVAEQYLDVLEDVNTTESYRAVAVQELIKLVPELKEEDLAYGKNLDKVREQIALYSLAQASRIEIDKLVQNNSELLSKKNEINQINSIKGTVLRADAMRNYLLEKGGWLGSLVEERVEAGEVESIQKAFKRRATKIEEEAAPIIKRIQELTKLLRLDPTKDPKGKKEKREKVSNFDFEIIDPEKEVKKAKKTLKAVASALGIDMKKNPLEIDSDLDLSLSPETQDRLKKAMAAITKDLQLTSTLNEYRDYAQQTKEVIGAMTDFVSSEFDRELTIEQNKTNSLNNELNKRLLNENLSKEERKNIQNQIAQNDEKLRIKQESIEKKRFKMQKAANIATALIDTFRAAAGVMAEAKGGFFTRLSQALPTIAFGMAQVASIARQKFQGSAGSSPRVGGYGSSVGQGSERAEPSFNIVGRSNENVLMSAIQSQFNQPLRAYVVARDVTNQQQLDGVISGAAST